MKKVLTLSALGCLATIGAVFAAFTLDPTTEGDIENSNIDVDFSSNVFSEFELIKDGKFTYKNGNEESKWVKDITLTAPSYTFRPVTTTAGGIGETLDLHCNDTYNPTKWQDYLSYRSTHPDPDPVEEAELAPHGHAFRYTFDPKFIELVEGEDPSYAGLLPWQYHIFKTNFSTGLTSSAFKAHADEARTADPHGLDEYGITYTDPDAQNPVYHDFTWTKQPDNPAAWVGGCDGFIIIPDKDQAGDAEKDSGTIIFSGQEMTDNIFGGAFTSEDLKEACRAYLAGSEDPKTDPHKDFSVRVKASEYFYPHAYQLNYDATGGDVLTYINGKGETLNSNNKYQYSIPVKNELYTMLTNGYEFGKLYTLATHSLDPIPLLTSDTNPSALGLKVTVNNPVSGVKTDITDCFKYGNDSTDKEHYGTIYYDVHESNAGYEPTEEDVVTFEFFYKKGASEVIETNWNKTQVELVKPTLTYEENLVDDAAGKYVFSAAAPKTTDNTKIVRFITPVDVTKNLELFTLTSDGTTQRKLDLGVVSVYLRDPNGHLEDVYKNYCVEEDGKIRINTQTLYTDFNIKADKEGYDILVDFKTNKDEEEYQSATFTYTNAPVKREFTFNAYVSQTPDVALSSGSFETSNGATINEGDTLVFKAILKDQAFITTASAVGTETIKKAQFKLAIFNDGTDPVSFGTAASFNVLRDNDEGTVKEDDTKIYKYADPVLEAVDVTEPAAMTVNQYIGTLAKDSGDKPNLTFTTVYYGPTVTFTKAQLALVIPK